MNEERPPRTTVIPSVPESLSLVDRYSSVDGTFATTRDVRIEGELRGTLRCDGYVHVAEGATIEATVEAANITVAGNLRGSISCRGKLTILATGDVRGTISTRVLVVNEGGACEGEIQMEMDLVDTTDRPALPSANRPEARRPRHRPLDERGEQRGTAIPVPNA